MARRLARSQWSHLYANRRWRALRATHLQGEPLCRYCERKGVLTPADVVDHIEPHRGDMAKFWGNALQSLCHHCHSSVKQREEADTKPGSLMDGSPDDPAHRWNTG